MSGELESLDFRHLKLHTDCVALEYRFQLLAVTCYQLDENSPTDSQLRAGSVNFYSILGNEGEIPVLKDVKVQLDGHPTLLPSLTCPAGVFDIRWSLNTAEPSSSVALLNLALSDGSLRRYEVIPLSTAATAESDSSTRPSVYESVKVKELMVLPSVSENDLAIGVDVARISKFSMLEDGELDDADDELDPTAQNLQDPENSPSELAAVGYQTGALAVFDLNSSSLEPIWSSSDAHMAEIWQTQWIHDSSYDHIVKKHSPNSLNLTTESYGRKVGSLFLSGSDDCSLKLWDVRRDADLGAVAVNRKHYSMGVTSFASPLASPCRVARTLLPNCVLVGSYDESLSIWDLRLLSRPVSSIKLGGGVWRLRWLPTLPLFSDAPQIQSSSDSGKEAYLAVAAMHAGFKVVRVSQSGEMEAQASTASIEETKGYWGPHKGSNDGKFPPLAYGIDWAVGPSNSSRSRLIASCTFYDNCLSLWKG